VPAATLLLGAALLVAGGFAVLHDASPSDGPRVVAAAPAGDNAGDVPAPEETDPTEGMPTSGDPTRPPPDLMPALDEEPAAIVWSVPPGWKTVPSPSTMRLATYAVPHAPGDAEDADVSVTRAGGDVAANVARWVGQFSPGRETARRSEKVHGLDVTVVEVEGDYTSMMHPEVPQRGWALLGAIVAAPGQPYFFKMTGPATTVHAARPAFARLLDSVESTRGTAPPGAASAAAPSGHPI
jgi:hypothetical protein